MATLADGKPLSKASAVTLFADPAVHIIYTDNKGSFEVKPEYLRANNLKKSYFLLQLNTAVTFTDPYLYTNKMVTKYTTLASSVPPHVTTEDNNLNGMESERRLKEVTIKDDNDLTIYGTKRYPGSNACGDYVCPYGVLNCSVHTVGSPPVIGSRYAVNGSPNRIVYEGCEMLTKKTNLKFIDNPVMITPEYYSIDSLSIADSLPEYISTIFWQGRVVLNKVSDTEYSFYTSDVTGEFKIIVQGIANKDVIVGEQKFTVKK